MWARLGVGGTGEGLRAYEARMKTKQEEQSKPRTAKNTTMYPASGPSCGGNTPTAALAYSLYNSSVYKYSALLELYEEQW